MAEQKPEIMSRETVGNGIHDPHHYRIYSDDGGTPVRMYADPDISWLVWNLKPGQENSTHVHPERAHALVVLGGSGLYVLGEKEETFPIQQGTYIIVPRGTVHGVRNTGSEPLSYLTISNNNQAVNTRTPVGEQAQMGGR